VRTTIIDDGRVARGCRRHVAPMGLLIGVAAGVAGCGNAANDLWGSVGEEYTLEFDSVAILKQGDALRIEYTKAAANGIDKVLKLTLMTTGLDLHAGSDLRGETFLSAVTVERLVTEGGNFPTVSAGQLHFQSFDFIEGGSVTGDFTILFDNGRTLFGTFDGRVKTMSAS
jgi:hypothetical protein